MKLTKIGGLWLAPISLVLVGTLLGKDLDTKIDRSYIAQQVAQAINASVDRTLKAHEPKADLRQMHKNRGFEPSGNTIYLLPYWPVYTTYFDDNDFLTAYASFSTASQSYSGHGRSKNLSTLIFGEQPLVIQDMLLASRLSAAALVEVSGMTPVETQKYYYLSILANQQVNFDASLDQGQVALSYARHFRDGDLTLGLYLPIKIRGQRLHITNDMTPQNRQTLVRIANGINPVTGSPPCVLASGVSTADKPELNFFERYDDLNDFVTDIINKKGMGFPRKETIVGLGDVMAYINLDIPSNYCARLVTGLSLLIPTARARDMGKIWDAELGNGGFLETSWYGSVLWEHSRWFNPYIHATATYRFESSVYRRVPRFNTYDGLRFNGVLVGGPDTPAKGSLILGQALLFESNFSQQPDTTIRNFADKPSKVKVAPGAELFCRIGNTFDAVFSDHAFFDLFYDLHVKGKDYVTHRPNDDVYIPGILDHNTAYISHTLGANYSYQFDESFRLRLGLWYVVAGCNTPKTFGVEFGFNAEF